MHFLNNPHKRNITNINLIPGVLQWTRFESKGIPINIFTPYLSGRVDDKENDVEAMNSITNAVLTCRDEHVIINGDLNINTINPSNGRDKEWCWLFNLLQLTEYKTNNKTYIRRQQNRITTSRLDHIFVSKDIKVIKEELLPPLTSNDHIPFYIDIEFKSHLNWRSYIGKKKREEMIKEINTSNANTFQELNAEIQNNIAKYGTKVDRLGGSIISSIFKGKIRKLENKIMGKLEDPNVGLNEISELQTILKETHIQSCKEIKEQLTDKYNNSHASHMYQFDRKLHSKEIIWKELPFGEQEILDYFSKKFTTSNQTPTFMPSPSTITSGPRDIGRISYRDVKETIKRMKSNTPGQDEISLDIIKGLKLEKLALIVEEFNKCLTQGDIPQEWKHEEGGLGVPSIEEFTDRLNLRTLSLIANSNNKLVQKAFKFGISHTNDNSNNIFIQWMSILQKYNLDFKKNHTKFRLKKVNETNRCFIIHTDGSKLAGKTGMGINIYESGGRLSPCKSLSLRINNEYSNNVAEIGAIITAMKLLPNGTTARIHTDSKVAIDVLSRKYKGNFLPFKTEFFNIQKEKNISVYIIKVKGHEDKENIIVDRLAKDGTERDKIFDIKSLLTNQYLLMKNDIVIFDCKRMTVNRQLKEMHEAIDSNPNFIPNQSWSSINVAYLKSRLSPKTKYQIWRNASNSHIKYTQKKDELNPTCSDCNCPSNLEHYIHECPRLDNQRRYCQNRLTEILDRPECSLSPIQEIPFQYSYVLYFHHSGITFFENEYIDKIPNHNVLKKWPEIQAAISKFIGRAFLIYQIDSKPIYKRSEK
ncbi:predicted protein [Naegleria gruberi]|uniref:Predicted protein n=1 Tax=Naegleria gruberi TaxID=5762 RepID=D2W286_NAEGR|nr:uncharacterized protein NAEGRDRAFT_54134 [Naegleria gruberi]EFC36780.1 predicted protein [Naegleria gruberi]|eukprot:XP_002669524.1 predicted protein [Naegleria gruberi strain NEG-M]